MTEVAVELRPHKGVMFDPRTQQTIEYEHDQWIVLARVGQYFGANTREGFMPMQIGYLGKWKGAQLATIAEWLKVPTGDRDAVLEAISEIAGWTVEVIDFPSTVTGLPEIQPSDEQSSRPSRIIIP